jgi:threonine synthase
MSTRYIDLICHECGKSHSKSVLQSFCKDCNQPLVAQYNFSDKFDKSILHDRPFNMWRYKEFLPIEDENHIVSLQEGWTPIIPLNKTSQRLDIREVGMKEEGGNPTGSFKARGISMAVSKAYELGVKSFCIPTAGNAGSALAAYVARMGGDAHIYMPKATPKVFQKDCEIMGAQVTKVNGSIRDAGKRMAQEMEGQNWWDITTLKEPFRLEGKKTMGLEIAEQFKWKLPDVIIYPTGGGTGLIGIWKAFHELKELGWVDEIPTRMVAVQSASCDPVVKAFQNNESYTQVYNNPGETIANGLRVPKAFGDKLIMKTLYESNGTAISFDDEEIIHYLEKTAKDEGLFLSPEGGAVMGALEKLRESNFIKKSDSVVVLNTGSAYKYIENLIA